MVVVGSPFMHGARHEGPDATVALLEVVPGEELSANRAPWRLRLAPLTRLHPPVRPWHLSAMVALVSSPTAAPSLGDVEVTATDGSAVRLSSLWTTRPVVLVFVRHWGCLFCKEQVADFAAGRADFDAAGVDVVVIGHGEVNDAADFAARFAAGMRVLTDTTRAAYCAASMKRGMRTAMSLGVVTRAARAMKRGFRQTQTQGDPLQQGGVVVVGRDGATRYAFISDEAGQHPPLNDVLAAVRAI
jgi:peroxiredoxin